MKKRLMLLLMMLSVLLTACSKYDPLGDYTCGWENGMVMFGNTPLAISEYKGYECRIENGNGGLKYIFTLDTNAKDPSNITVNRQGITMDNMTKYKDKYYYLEYLGSMMTMVKPVIEGQAYAVCQVTIKGTDANAAAKYVSDYMDTIKLANGTLYCDFGSFVFGNDYSEIVVKSDGASVKGTIKVSPGSKGATTPVQLTQGKKTIDMVMTSTEKYDYYEYDGYLIQVVKGILPTDYITFK